MQQHKVRLCVERLEDRLALSGAPFSTPPNPGPPSFQPPACVKTDHADQGLSTAADRSGVVLPCEGHP
jgi:hypothetical protein